MDERAFYSESQTTKPASLNCPYCRTQDTYELRWVVRKKKDRLPSGADDRYFYGDDRQRLGQLGTQLDLQQAGELGLVDEWLGIDVALGFSRPSNVWAYPVQAVSQSEGGFELVHQSVVVEPHWLIQGDAQGRWSINMTLSIDTSLAESRMEKHVAAAAT